MDCITIFDIGTTPTLTMTVPDGVNLSLYDKILFTLQQGSIKLERADGTVVEDTAYTVKLTQAETLLFKRGTAQLQLNMMAGADRFDTAIATVFIGPNLHESIIEESE